MVLEMLAGTAAPVVTVEAPPMVSLAMAAREGMAAMVVRVQEELLAARLVPMEPQAVWVGLVATEATPSRAPQEMAALAEMAVSQVPAGLVSARLLQEQTAVSAAMEDLVGLLVPVEQEAPLSERTATAETVGMVVSLVCRAMEATEPPVTRSLPMAATAVRAATPGLQALAGTADRREAALVPPEPVDRMALMALMLQAEAMEATVAMVLTRQRPAQLEAMAEPVEPEVWLAMAEPVERAATVPQEPMVLRDRIPATRVATAKSVELAGMVEPAAQGGQFQAMVEMAEWLDWAGLVAWAEPEQMEWTEFRPVKPAGLEAMVEPVEQAEPEVWAAWAVRPQMAWRARTEGMPQAELEARGAQVASAGTVLLVQLA